MMQPNLDFYTQFFELNKPSIIKCMGHMSCLFHINDILSKLRFAATIIIILCWGLTCECGCLFPIQLSRCFCKIRAVGIVPFFRRHQLVYWLSPMIHCVLCSTPSGFYNEKRNCLITLTWLKHTQNSQHNRKQRNTTKRGTLNCTIHKLTYSVVIYRRYVCYHNNDISYKSKHIYN